MNIKKFGLKTKYNFKETHIQISWNIQEIYQKLRQFVTPAIQELEKKRFINGFHYIIHKHIDLRLSCSNWKKHEDTIKSILAKHSISPCLTDCELGPARDYGGNAGVLLCYNNLEMNSRICLALIEDNPARHPYPSQWIHYLINQYGYADNRDQILFEFKDAFSWLKVLLRNNNFSPWSVSAVRSILKNFKQSATRFEKSLIVKRTQRIKYSPRRHGEPAQGRRRGEKL